MQPTPLSQEGQHRYPDACLSASPRTMSCCSGPANPTSSPRAASLAGAASPCVGGPVLSCGLGSGQVTQPGAGFATWHGVALSPCSSCLTRARGAESRPISCALSSPVSRQRLHPAQPSRPGRNHWHAAECQAPACREVVSAYGRCRLVLSQPRELGRCQPGSGTKQAGDRAPVNITPYGHQPMQ